MRKVIVIFIGCLKSKVGVWCIDYLIGIKSGRKGVCIIVVSGRGNDCGGYFYIVSVLYILYSMKLYVMDDLKCVIVKGDSFFCIVIKKVRCGGYC